MWSAQYVKQFLDSCHNAAVVDKLTKDKTEIQEKIMSIWLNIRRRRLESVWLWNSFDGGSKKQDFWTTINISQKNILHWYNNKTFAPNLLFLINDKKTEKFKVFLT